MILLMKWMINNKIEEFIIKKKFLNLFYNLIKLMKLFKKKNILIKIIKLF